MSINDNDDAEIEEIQPTESCQPELVDFMIRSARCYGEWAMVIGLACMGVAGVIFLEREGDADVAFPILNAGLFGVITGCAAIKSSNVIEDNRSSITEDVTFSV